MASRWCRLYEGTPAELAIEPAIAALGVPYRNQFPGFLYGLRYYLDFVLPTLGLVIEVDDPSHERKTEEDAERTAAIAREWGWRVVRCKNEEALNDPRGTVQRLLKQAKLWPPPTTQPPLTKCLPERKRAPAKNRRAAKTESLRARRSGRIPGRRPSMLVRPPPPAAATTSQSSNRSAVN